MCDGHGVWEWRRGWCVGISVTAINHSRRLMFTHVDVTFMCVHAHICVWWVLPPTIPLTQVAASSSAHSLPKTTTVNSLHYKEFKNRFLL